MITRQHDLIGERVIITNSSYDSVTESNVIKGERGMIVKVQTDYNDNVGYCCLLLDSNKYQWVIFTDVILLNEQPMI